MSKLSLLTILHNIDHDQRIFDGNTFAIVIWRRHRGGKGYLRSLVLWSIYWHNFWIALGGNFDHNTSICDRLTTISNLQLKHEGIMKWVRDRYPSAALVSEVSPVFFNYHGLCLLLAYSLGSYWIDLSTSCLVYQSQFMENQQISRFALLVDFMNWFFKVSFCNVNTSKSQFDKYRVDR